MRNLIGSHLLLGWVEIQWDRGNKNSYRYGKDSAFDVKDQTGNGEIRMEEVGTSVASTT